MLRVRPVHFTSHLEQWARLLTDIGMVKTAGNGSWQEFDAGSGRLALQAVENGSPADGTTAFGVEVGNLEEFARRTNEAAAQEAEALEAAAMEAGDTQSRATEAANETAGREPAGVVSSVLVDSDHGRACRVLARDGFSFLADQASHGANCADADPALTVVGVWFTEDTVLAAAALRSIGARPRPVPDNDETADFAAKNGGVLMARPAIGPARAGLGFEYGGDLDALQGRLTSAGWEVSSTEEYFVRTLHLPNPDAEGSVVHHPRLWIAGRR
jgi:hypothetical protein